MKKKSKTKFYQFTQNNSGRYFNVCGITNQLLQQQFIEKWDGKTPIYGNIPITLFKNAQ